ncbi:MAG: DUF86 domain-containing protein [Burkholderiales bacterium]|nr:DUF86 domain-containing protein [Burkholderiales bacterium]
MSDGSPAREWRFYVEDMLVFCGKVGAYTQGLDRASFAADPMPWRLVIAVRNRLIHGYLGIDDDTLWSTIQDDLAPLRHGLTKLLATRP